MPAAFRFDMTVHTPMRFPQVTRENASATATAKRSSPIIRMRTPSSPSALLTWLVGKQLTQGMPSTLRIRATPFAALIFIVLLRRRPGAERPGRGFVDECTPGLKPEPAAAGFGSISRRWGASCAPSETAGAARPVGCNRCRAEGMMFDHTRRGQKWITEEFYKV